MNSQGISKIKCPRTRCNDCPNMNQSLCLVLDALRNNGRHGQNVILSEKKGLLHLWSNREYLPVHPPWEEIGWDTVYLGDTEQSFDFESIIEAYLVGPYMSIFYEKRDEGGLFHVALPLVKTALESALLNNLSSYVNNLFHRQLIRHANFSERLYDLANLISEEIAQFLPEMNNVTMSRISKIVANRSSVFEPFIPLFIDDNVEEIYLDRPNSLVYFDHRILGRCQTSFSICDDDVSRVITLIRSESNHHLDRRNPSLKTNFTLFGVELRISVSIPPLSHDGLHLEIRRANKSPFTLASLVLNDTLTVKAATILHLGMICRFNITITGGPGTGKTTLLNALDMSSPRKWRKVYVEDAIESRILQNCHQVRLRVDPVDERNGIFDKTSEILKSLHRSPDYLILGEIQTKEHSEALFQAVAAGLCTMQTCHSSSASSLVSRWNSTYGIKKDSIALMDLIVSMDRPVPGQSVRRVREIVEVCKTESDGFLHFSGLNRVYDAMNPENIRWNENGAFHFHARRVGVASPVAAFEALARLIEESIHNEITRDAYLISEKMWSCGHPMKFEDDQV